MQWMAFPSVTSHQAQFPGSIFEAKRDQWTRPSAFMSPFETVEYLHTKTIIIQRALLDSLGMGKSGHATPKYRQNSQNFLGLLEGLETRHSPA